MIFEPPAFSTQTVHSKIGHVLDCIEEREYLPTMLEQAMGQV
jgi:hypothetical protein